ncbi:MAG: response regulator [Chloroflexi bacterium]|nr:response regulator [Chloroflexota bacterium]
MQLPKILLVDDEPAITDNLAPFLERAGFAVAVAANGEAALLQAAAVAPDLIILDVLMPRLDGREALRRLRRAGNWTPVLLLTRVGESTVRAFEEGAKVVIEVADTGPGIPEAEVPHVWKELYRTQGAQGAPGSGLGLALVRAIVDGHGGQVSLRSRLGQGTVVTMRLPVR